MAADGEFLTGDGSVDRLTGGTGDDTLQGNGGNDVLKGGGGTDTAIFSGNLVDYQWTTTSKGYSITGPDGTDSLESIEILQFDDFTYRLDGMNVAVVSYPTDTLKTTVGVPLEFTISGYDIDDPSYFFYITNQVYGLMRTELAQTSIGMGNRVDATYTYSVSTDDYRALAAGEARVETLNYSSGGTDPSTKVYFSTELIVYGINDAPELTVGPTNPIRTVMEDAGAARYEFSFFAADIDSDDEGTTLTYEVVSGIEGLSITFDGSEMVLDALDNFQLLSEGQFFQDTITIRAQDRHGAVSNTLDVDIRVEGANDPLQVFLTPAGEIDYPALGLDPSTAAFQGVVSGYINDARVPNYTVFTEGDDTLVFNGNGFYNFNDNASAFAFYELPWTDLTLDAGAGNDRAVFRLTGQTGEIANVDLSMGDGENVTIIDIDTSKKATVSNLDFGAGTHSSQLLIDIDTTGSVSFFGSDYAFGDGNDVMHVDIDATGEVNEFGLITTVLSQTDISMGGGHDELVIEVSITDAGEIDFSGRVSTWTGDDYVRLDNLASVMTDGFPFDGISGFSGSVDLGSGDDAIDFLWKTQVGETALGYISGGIGFDTLTLWGAVADWSVTVRADNWYVLTNAGQSIDVDGFEAIFAQDGKLLPADENGLNVINGSNSPDYYEGTESGDLIRGYGGNDTIYGLGGDDSLDGGGISDTLVGGEGNDTLVGGNGADDMRGGAGDDVIYVDSYSDIVDGGAGFDRVRIETNFNFVLSPANFTSIEQIDGGGGHDTLSAEGHNTSIVLSGEAGDDYITGSNYSDHLSGGLDADMLSGEGGNDTLLGEDGADDIDGGSGSDSIRGGTGNDTLEGGFGNDTMFGDNDADVMTALGGVNLMFGGFGNDAITGAAANDTLNGGGGADTLDGGNSTDVFIVDGDDIVTDTGAAGFDNAQILSQAGDTIDMSTWSGVERVNGNIGNDVIDGSSQSGSLTLTGGLGDDSLVGGAGNDILIGGEGNDTLIGGDGANTFLGGTGNDEMTGGADNDVFFIGESGDVIVDAGGGFDRALISELNVSIAVGTWANVERIVGFDGDDTIDATGGASALILTGSGGADSLTGTDFADTFLGGTGADIIAGGGGNDTIEAGAGADQMTGGGGNDLFFVDDAGDVVSDGGTGEDVVAISNFGGLSIDVGAWLSVERIVGQNGSDDVDATGMATAITMLGGDGDDTLTGGSGNDSLIGGQNDDVLGGGAGNDLLIGASGADTFVFDDGFGQDVVTDYLDGTDRLDFTAHSGVNNIGDLAITQSGDDTVITLTAGGSDQITLVDVLASSVTTGDIDFV